MNINTNYSVYFLLPSKESFLAALSPLNKKIMAVAAIAFACIFAFYLIYLGCRRSGTDFESPKALLSPQTEAEMDHKIMQINNLGGKLLLYTIPQLLSLAKAKGAEIKFLYLADRDLLNKELEALISHCPNLEKLTLCGIFLTDKGFKQIGQLHALKELSLISGDVSDTALNYIAQCPSLTELSLSLCDKISDKGLSYLAKLTTLQYLNIWSCSNIIGERLSDLKRLLNLRELNLTDCKGITDSSLKQLAQLSNLQKISLDGCPITAAGLTPLASLSSLKNLSLKFCDKVKDEPLPELGGVSILEKLRYTVIIET